jgi:Bacterial Ig domain
VKIYKHIIFLFIVWLAWQWNCSLPSIDDITAPVILIVYPANGAVVAGNDTIAIESTDDEGVEKVWLYLDNKVIGVSSKPNAQFEINLAPYADNQTHVLLAAAADKAGNIGYSTQITVTISDYNDVTPPTVQIVNPIEGQVVEDTVHILASADDNRGIDRVAFYIDGDSITADTDYPYEHDWLTGGLSDSTSHGIFAKAYDLFGNWAVSAVIRVTVYPRSKDVIAPAMILLYPLAESILTGTVRVTISASDNIGVTRMEFYVDGGNNAQPNFSKTSAPWIYNWDTSTWADGAKHTLFVKAYDLAGNVGTLGPIAYTIQ